MHVLPLGFSNSKLAFLPPYSTLVKWHTGDLTLLGDVLTLSDAAGLTYSVFPATLPSVRPATGLVSLASSNTSTFFPLRPNTDWICDKRIERNVTQKKTTLKLLVS